ncbi:MAG TPA: FAD:protein FMN transferase [Acidiferrobacteraceae bacterium]|nr:FAD:protein FMN transferase [Acidiferrobacteraceae bacterium]HEX19256.1 FAD:protein FMN transferase [Acidiferrobacteraceae bacterium]
MKILSRREFIKIGAVVLLSGCTARGMLYQRQFYVFGTLLDISIWGVSIARARHAVNSLHTDFQIMHRDWHAWKPGALTRLNQAFALNRSATVGSFLLPLIALTKDLYQRSDGMFNPAIGRLVALWGFHNDELPVGPPPSKQAVAILAAKVPTMDDIVVRGNIVRSRNPIVQLDFGGFAKGYALDLAIQRLRGMGVDNAIINAGGDLRAIGLHGDRPWRIGVRHPQGQGVLGSLETHGDESVFTSGNYERYHEYEGIRRSHIIDPRSGIPVKHIASATVIHDNAAVADTAATALSVAGPAGWHRTAKRLGIKLAMLVDEHGTIYMNPAMAKRMRFGGLRPDSIVIGDPL